MQHNTGELENGSQRFHAAQSCGCRQAGAFRSRADEQEQTLVYRVAGFTCVTCAVGLQTLLGRQKGVAHVEAAYPSGTVKIKFDPALLDHSSLRTFIEEMGFRVTEERGL
jgi:copper chaperone CopZ